MVLSDVSQMDGWMDFSLGHALAPPSTRSSAELKIGKKTLAGQDEWLAGNAEAMLKRPVSTDLITHGVF